MTVEFIKKKPQPGEGKGLQDKAAKDGKILTLPRVLTPEEIRAADPRRQRHSRRAQPREELHEERYGVEDFYAYLPGHQYIFVRTRELWPAASVNSRVPPVTGEDGKPTKPSEWLDQNQAVEQMVWAPGEPTIIHGRLLVNGGWLDSAQCSCFNLYVPPPPRRAGDAQQAGPWLAHIEKIYPDDVGHIVRWLAHRVQRPQEKINHALLLGGRQGIGKDTLLEPIKYAVGSWNFVDVSPAHLLGRFNGFVKSVILRVSEARDLGDIGRYAFYDHMKVFTASPPDVLRCDEKNIREHSVVNVCGVILTTNYKGNGVYLPADDRRHYVAWSEADKKDFDRTYWTELYKWYAEGGYQHVAAFLAGFDLSDFDAKAPPPHTAAFWDIVDANRAPEDAELADALDLLGNPPAVTLHEIAEHSQIDFRTWLEERKNRRQIPHRLETAGYVPVRNPNASDGLWVIACKRQAIYGRTDLTVNERLAAATAKK